MAGERRRVIIGVDGSARSEHAFDWYAEHLHKKENYVIVIHSVEVHHTHLYPSVFVQPEVMQAEFQKEKSKSAKLEEFYVERLKQRNIEGEFIIRSGKPGEAIVALANDKKPEMIVVGTRGHGKLRRTILGSVSDYIVHHAHCAVITVRPDVPL